MLEKLIVFVEEYSMEVALEMILPKMLGDVEFQIIRFQCKDDLLKKLPMRLKGYSRWMPANWTILVLVDRDDDDCIVLKGQLEEYSKAAGLLTKTKAPPLTRFKVANRIVIEELEAWYFGDWEAVKAAYPKVPKTIPGKAPYRDPDAISGGTWEALERIFKRAGYFTAGLRKLDCARQIGQNMNPDQNRSQSFKVFYNTINAVLAWE